MNNSAVLIGLLKIRTHRKLYFNNIVSIKNLKEEKYIFYVVSECLLFLKSFVFEHKTAMETTTIVLIQEEREKNGFHTKLKRHSPHKLCFPWQKNHHLHIVSFLD